MGILAWIVFSLCPFLAPRVILKFPILVGLPVLCIWAINFYVLIFCSQGIRDIIKGRSKC